MAETTPEALYSTMLRQSLWVVTTRPARGPGFKEVLPRHLEYQIGLERRNTLFGAGPIFEDGDGAPPTGGMIILRAKDEAEARAIADADPFHAAGLRQYSLHRWLLNEGAMTLTVRYSDQSAKIG